MESRICYLEDNKGNKMKLQEINGGFYNILVDKVPSIIQDMKNFKTRPDDVWITGFQKSGTSWLREIVGMLMLGDPNYHDLTNQGNVDLLGVGPIDYLPSPRMLKLHFHPGYMPTVIQDGSKVIHIIRNPKDQAVSSYYFAINPFLKTEYKGTFGDYLSIHDQRAFFGKLDWFDFVKEWWIVGRNNPNILFVFYEELIKDPIKIMREIAAFLGKSYSEEFYTDVAHKTAFANMREAKQNEQVAGNYGNKKSYFRKGIIGNWKNHFTVKESGEFDKRYNQKLADFPDLKERIQFE